ncbi:hypothetical protein B0H66DRAFT_355349 [Apodospora peruviana]|uniref:Uncharacterized protein n=1 Tax=Apodospora peruviana TaxID=516989 RepID=A0AAE0LZP8_9PEZI|nr:hypothetical protein B0H66DRAFT_355349 [Apodospora peruviana]
MRPAVHRVPNHHAPPAPNTAAAFAPVPGNRLEDPFTSRSSSFTEFTFRRAPLTGSDGLPLVVPLPSNGPRPNTAGGTRGGRPISSQLPPMPSPWTERGSASVLEFEPAQVSTVPRRSNMVPKPHSALVQRVSNSIRDLIGPSSTTYASGSLIAPGSFQQRRLDQAAELRSALMPGSSSPISKCTPRPVATAVPNYAARVPVVPSQSLLQGRNRVPHSPPATLGESVKLGRSPPSSPPALTGASVPYDAPGTVAVPPVLHSQFPSSSPLRATPASLLLPEESLPLQLRLRPDTDTSMVPNEAQRTMATLAPDSGGVPPPSGQDSLSSRTFQMIRNTLGSSAKRTNEDASLSSPEHAGTAVIRRQPPARPTAASLFNNPPDIMAPPPTSTGRGIQGLPFCSGPQFPMPPPGLDAMGFPPRRPVSQFHLHAERQRAAMSAVEALGDVVRDEQSQAQQLWYTETQRARAQVLEAGGGDSAGITIAATRERRDASSVDRTASGFLVTAAPRMYQLHGGIVVRKSGGQAPFIARPLFMDMPGPDTVKGEQKESEVCI